MLINYPQESRQRRTQLLQLHQGVGQKTHLNQQVIVMMQRDVEDPQVMNEIGTPGDGDRGAEVLYHVIESLTGLENLEVKVLVRTSQRGFLQADQGVRVHQIMAGEAVVVQSHPVVGDLVDL